MSFKQIEQQKEYFFKFLLSNLFRLPNDTKFSKKP